MTKQKWLEHMRKVGDHDRRTCPECQARAKTWKANRARKDRDAVYKSCGLVKVRGLLGGVYWE